MSVTLQDSTTRRYQDNVDAAEVAKFEALASRWWDPESEFKPLHDINPLRLDFIDARAGLAGNPLVRRVRTAAAQSGLPTRHQNE